MSSSSQDSNDLFSVSKRNVKQFFTEIEKTSPKYHQSIIKLQQDYVDAWKTMINSAINLEKEYSTKAGFVTNVPESVLKTIQEIAEMSIQAYLRQNQLTLETIKTSKQVFSKFNENTKSFDALNRDIIEYLMSAFEKSRKEEMCLY